MFIEICEHLYQHFVLKMKIKDENCDPVTNVDIQAMLNQPKATVMQSVPISSTPPPGIVVTAAAQGTLTLILKYVDIKLRMCYNYILLLD